jgi:hypothetical protein
VEVGLCNKDEVCGGLSRVGHAGYPSLEGFERVGGQLKLRSTEIWGVPILKNKPMLWSDPCAFWHRHSRSAPRPTDAQSVVIQRISHAKLMPNFLFCFIAISGAGR